MAQPARAGVNQHHHLALADSVGARGRFVVHLFHVLDLQKMIAASQRSELRQAAFARALGYRRGVGALERAARLGEIGVALLPKTVLHHPARAFHQDSLQVARADLDESRASHAARHIAENLLHQLPQSRPYIALFERGPHQPHAAVDVEADAAGRDHAAIAIHGRHAADGETVALVNIGHGQARPHDSRQRGHVHGLFQREVFADLRHQGLAGVHHDVGPHAPGFIAGNAMAKRVDGFDPNQISNTAPVSALETCSR